MIDAYLAYLELYLTALTEEEVQEAMLMSTTRNVGKPVPTGEFLRFWGI